MNKELSPIVLFVYNRPWHTGQTIEALQKNELAKESELFIYCDNERIGVRHCHKALSYCHIEGVN